MDIMGQDSLLKNIKLKPAFVRRLLCRYIVGEMLNIPSLIDIIMDYEQLQCESCSKLNIIARNKIVQASIQVQIKKVKYYKLTIPKGLCIHYDILAPISTFKDDGQIIVTMTGAPCLCNNCDRHLGQKCQVWTGPLFQFVSCLSHQWNVDELFFHFNSQWLPCFCLPKHSLHTYDMISNNQLRFTLGLPTNSQACW